MGIGTTTPQVELEVHASATGDLIVSGDVAASFILRDYGSAANQKMFQLFNDNASMVLRILGDDLATVQTNIMYWTTGGLVGVGTSSPGGTLSVSGAATTPALLVNQTSTGDLLTLQDNGTTIFKVVDGGAVGIGTSTPWGSKFAIEMDDSNFSMVVANTGSSSPAFYIGSAAQDGNIGIGTVSPNAKVDIRTLVTDSSATPSAIDINGAYIRIGDPATGQTFTNGVGIKFTDQNVAHASIKYTGSATRLDFCDSSGGVTLVCDSGEERLSINTGTGLIGVGTTSPSSLLHLTKTTAADTDLRFESQTYNWIMGVDNSAGGSFKISSSTALGTSDRLTITGRGDVGIGTSPTAGNKLHIVGDGTTGVGAGVHIQSASNALIFTHTNTNYRGALGTQGNSGAPFLALHAEDSTTIDTFRNDGTGLKGVVLKHNNGELVEFIWNGVATANANFSSTVTGFSVHATGTAAVGASATDNVGFAVRKNVLPTGGLTYAYGANIQQTLTAVANSDVLTAVNIVPTFTNGSFSSVSNNGVQVSGTEIYGRGGFFRATGSGNSFMWGHNNTSFLSTIGTMNTNGFPYIGFYAYHSTSTANTLMRASATTPPSVWQVDSSGYMVYQTAAAGTIDSDITFATKFSITNGGYVGIGITAGLGSPNSLLHIGTTTSSASNNLLRIDDSSGDSTPFVVRGDGSVGVSTSTPGGFFSVSAGGAIPAVLVNQTSIGDLLTLQDSGTTRFQVLDGGNVIVNTGNLGIGTTSPGTVNGTAGFGSLHVAGANARLILDGTDDAGIWFNDADATTGQKVWRMLVAGGTFSLSTLSDVGGSPSARFQINNSGDTVIMNANASALSLNFQNTTSSNGFLQYNGNDWRIFANSGSTPTLTITGGAPGNVGIGETSPASKLSVSGNATIGASYDTTAAPANGLLIEGATGMGTTSPGGFLSISVSTTSPAFILNQTSTGDLFTLQDSGSSVLTVKDGGKVGIGTSSPLEKLTLTGGSFFQAGGDAVTNYTPTLVGSTETVYGIGNSTTGNSVSVSGKYAYVGLDNFAVNIPGACSSSASTGCELHIYDVSTSTPAYVSGIDVGTSVYGLWVSNNLLFVGTAASTTFPEFIIYDVSNPRNPLYLGGFEDGSAVYSVVVVGKYAYLGGSGSLRIVDISDPKNPFLTGNAVANTTVNDVYVSGRYAYLVTESSGGNEFQIVDISNPRNPTVLGGMDFGVRGTTVFASGRYAYVGKGGGGISERFIIYDVSDPSSPATTSAITLANDVSSISVTGRYAYIGIGAVAGNDFLVYDIGDPRSPVLVGGAELGGGAGTGLFIPGRKAYVGASVSTAAEFRIYDLTGTEAQTLIAHSLEAGSLQVHQNLLAAGSIYGNSLNIGLGGINAYGGLNVIASSTATSTNTVVASFLGGYVGIGTTTPQWSLQVASSTKTFFTITDTNAGANLKHWSLGSMGGNFYLATSSDAYATSSVSALTVTSNQSLGIGTTSPAESLSTAGRLFVGGTGTSTVQNNLYVQGTLRATVSYVGDLVFSNNFRYVEGFNNAGADTLLLNGPSGNNVFTADDAGNVGLSTTSPATLFEVGGSTNNVTFGGYLSCSGFTSNANGLLACTASDERLKQDVVALGSESGLSAITSLRPVSFYWKPQTDRGGVQQYGLIAQEVESIFPNLVTRTNPTALTPGGTLSLNYEGLISPMVLAIQELNQKVDANASSTAVTLTSLESRLAALESGAVSSSAGASVFSTSTLADALESFGVLLREGVAQFNTLVFRRLVASTDADGSSSAGSVTIPAGNVIALVDNTLVSPSTKIFVTFNTQVTGSWWVSDKAAGSFRVVLSAPQASDVSFDYFLVQTEESTTSPTPTAETSGSDSSAPAPETSTADTSSTSGETAPAATTTDSATADSVSTTTSPDSTSSPQASSGQATEEIIITDSALPEADAEPVSPIVITSVETVDSTATTDSTTTDTTTPTP